MDDTTSVLFGLDGHRVLDVVRVGDRVVRVVIETIEREGSLPVVRCPVGKGQEAAGVDPVSWTPGWCGRDRGGHAAAVRCRCSKASGERWSRAECRRRRL
jgi:hypothetical protein